jgi:hypothetical protein
MTVARRAKCPYCSRLRGVTLASKIRAHQAGSGGQCPGSGLQVGTGGTLPDISDPPANDLGSKALDTGVSIRTASS